MASSDQYALGVVVYEWLCGAPPFHGTPFEIAMQHLSLPPPPLRELLPDLSPGIEEVVMRALAKEPGQRFASVQDFAAALQRACDEPVAVSVSPTSAVMDSAVYPRPTVPTLHIQLLGDFLLISGETPVTSVDVPRLQSLLAYLVIHRTAPQPRAHLAYQLWPDSTDAQALTNLRNAVYRLRHTLPDANSFLHVKRQGLQWQSERPDVSWTLDVQDFEHALAEADEAEHVQGLKAARQALTQAVEVYHGDLLPSCYDEWIIPERDRLRQAFLHALDRLVGLLEGEREYATAIGIAQRLLRLDPLHEATYRQLMRLYTASGDRASALRTYHTCTTVLERELGAEPSRATREAYERLLQLEVHVPESEEPRVASLAVTPLVGRQREWGHLQATWRNMVAGRPHMIILTGEAGIGKTRLAEELLSWVGRQGIITASAHCYAAEGTLPYAPVATWLRVDALRASLSTLLPAWRSEVARLLPDLLASDPDLPRPGPLTEGWQRQHLFEALARALLSGNAPRVVHLDDLQWCDRETLEWLHYLLRFDQQARLLLIGAIRSEEMSASSPLASFLNSLRRDGLVTEIELRPLNVADTTFLASHVAGHDLTSPDAAALYQETEGNPLFVVETIRAGTLDPGKTTQHPAKHAPTRHNALLPQTVQAVIAARLAQLSPMAHELINLAAVIGRAFTFAVLAQASGADEDILVSGLDELWQRRIVREQGQDAYDFSHDKLREVTYAALSSARRRRLHQRVAEALETVYAASLDTVNGQIANHYEHAGQLQQAISYYRRAGEASWRVYANREAITSFQRALALLDADPQGTFQQSWQQEVTADLYERMGDILHITGRLEEARDAYQDALTHISVYQQIHLARLHRKIGDIWQSQHRYEDVLQACRRAVTSLGQEPIEGAALWWQEWIEIQSDRFMVHYWLAQMDAMVELIEQMRPVVEQYGTPVQCAELFENCYRLNVRRDRYTISDETLEYGHAALIARQEIGSLDEIAWAQCDHGYHHLWRDNLEEAGEHIHAATAIAEQTGNVMVKLWCLIGQSLLYRKRGQVEETQRISLLALEVATAIPRPEQSGTAQANLAWVAWREGKVEEAQAKGSAALALWRSELLASIVYAFQWTALWPLIGSALELNHISEAVSHVRALLAPSQQRLPDALSAVLAAAIQAWDTDESDSARFHLQQAAALAQEMGYL